MPAAPKNADDEEKRHGSDLSKSFLELPADEFAVKISKLITRLSEDWRNNTAPNPDALKETSEIVDKFVEDYTLVQRFMEGYIEMPRDIRTEVTRTLVVATKTVLLAIKDVDSLKSFELFTRVLSDDHQTVTSKEIETMIENDKAALGKLESDGNAGTQAYKKILDNHSAFITNVMCEQWKTISKARKWAPDGGRKAAKEAVEKIGTKKLIRILLEVTDTVDDSDLVMLKQVCKDRGVDSEIVDKFTGKTGFLAAANNVFQFLMRWRAYLICLPPLEFVLSFVLEAKVLHVKPFLADWLFYDSLLWILALLGIYYLSTVFDEFIQELFISPLLNGGEGHETILGLKRLMQRKREMFVILIVLLISVGAFIAAAFIMPHLVEMFFWSGTPFSFAVCTAFVAIRLLSSLVFGYLGVYPFWIIWHQAKSTAPSNTIQTNHEQELPIQSEADDRKIRGSEDQATGEKSETTKGPEKEPTKDANPRSVEEDAQQPLFRGEVGQP